MENDLLKNKAAGISAILGSNKLSKEIKEALDSPFGSTKRKKAASILKAINANRNDGMGGGLEENTTFQPDISIRTSTTPAILPQAQKPETPKVQPPAAPGDFGIGKTDQQIGIGEPTAPGVQIFPSAPKLKTGTTQLPDFKISADTKIGIGDKGAELKIPDKMPETKEEVASFINEVDDDYIKTWYQGLSESDKKRWQPLYDAVESGVGAKTFAWNIMQDTESLKQLFPNIPEESFPQGASLVGQLKDVEDTLRDEFKLDDLKNNLDRLVEDGVTIEDDLTDYITTRDTYIEKLDNMIGNAKTSMVGMDMANPYVAKKMNGYLNYLYIMKGRQQKTYIDFLNSGINQYNQQLKTAENIYNTAYDRFERALKDKTDLTKEDHNFMTDMLEDMYTNLEGREKSMLQMEKLRHDVLQEQYDTASSAIDALTGADDVEFTVKDRTVSQKNYLEANPTKTIADWNKLSGEDKLSYLEEDETQDGGIESYVDEIIRAKAGRESSIFYDEDDEIIKWDKIPQKQRDAVRARYSEKVKELIRKAQEKGTTEQKKGILQKIRDLVGGKKKEEKPTFGIKGATDEAIGIR